MSELKKRIIFSLIAAPLFLVVMWLGGWYFKGLVVIMSLIIQREMMTMLKGAGYESNTLITYATGLWILLIFLLPHPLLIVFLLFLYIISTETLNQRPKHLERMTSTLFCGIYAPLALLSLILLRDLEPGFTGFALSLTLVFIIWGNDTLAYFGGKRFGKHPLAPDISPGKTREGFLFGFFGGLLGLIAAYVIIPSYPLSFMTALPMVIIVGFFGPVGDLAASKIKRSAGMKDSATILPGHGGFFDRLDALLLASPAVYIYVSLVLS
ncbi:MAG: phosphatidate cytidylyltransferase [Balneolales bacterium]